MSLLSHKPRRLTWTPKLVSQFWNGMAQTSLEQLSFSRLAGSWLALAVAHHLPPNVSCLDFGAGSGDLIQPLLEAGCTVAALERAKKRRATLEERFRHRHNFAGVIDASSHRVFDVVFVVEVMEHVLEEEFEATVQLIYRFLRPGGLLIITTPNHEDLDLGMCYCPTSNVLFHRWQHVRSMTVESLTALWERHGVDPIAVHQLEFTPALLAPLRDATADALPDYLRDLRQDRSMRMGSEASILYLGRRRPADPAVGR